MGKWLIGGNINNLLPSHRRLLIPPLQVVDLCHLCINVCWRRWWRRLFLLLKIMWKTEKCLNTKDWRSWYSTLQNWIWQIFIDWLILFEKISEFRPLEIWYNTFNLLISTYKKSAVDDFLNIIVSFFRKSL